MANAANLCPPLTFKSWLSSGLPNAFGTVATYSAGTTTPLQTYVDSTGTTQNLNPVPLNARGEANIWTPPNVGYKFIEFDQAGNQIKLTDQVIQNALITLYGGVDTGAPNAYILTFTASFTSLTNGIVIYWLPANTNTGASTLNVNGLGVVPIVNPNGSALGPNQIIANQMTSVVYSQGNWVLSSIAGFTGPLIGVFGTETPIASAATTDLGTAVAHVALVTGTTTITSFGSSASISAPIYVVRFNGVLTLTYNSSSLILPGGASIITSGGDALIAEYLGSGAWKVLLYQYSAGSSNTKIKPADTQQISNTTLTADPDLQSNFLAVGRYVYEVYLVFDSVAGGAGFKWTNDGTAVDSRGLSPALASGFVNAAAYGPKADTFYGTTITYANVSNTADSNQVLYKGSLLVGTAGTFGISWAQAVSTASATTLRAGSYLTTTLLTTGVSTGAFQHIYQTPGSFTETIPVGYNTLVIECWGGSGGGGSDFVSGCLIVGGGGGGGSGYSRTSMSITGLGGDTLNYTVGAGGAFGFPGVASSVSSGTLAITTMTSNGGTQGGSATSLVPGSGGVGGTASGGTVVNTNGNSGQAGNKFGGGGGGGIGISGIYDGGNPGGRGAPLGTSGGVGIVVFAYS